MKVVIKNGSLVFAQVVQPETYDVTQTVTSSKCVPTSIAVNDTFEAENYGYRALAVADVSSHPGTIKKIKIYDAYAKAYNNPYFVITDADNKVLYVSETMPHSQSSASDIVFDVGSYTGTAKYIYATVSPATAATKMEVTIQP